IEVAIGPAVQSTSDAGGQAIVDGGMTKCAGDADPRHRVAVEESLPADDRVGLEQLDRRAGLVEIDLSALDRFDQDLRQLPNINLKPALKRPPRREALTAH